MTAPAHAQVTSLGASPGAFALNGVGSGIAYDDTHDVYLHVFESNRQVLGRFIAGDGTLLGSPFDVGTHRQSFAGRPRVAYSHNDAGVDVFLVGYLSDANVFDRGANFFGQLVAYTGVGPTGGTLVGGPILISPNSGSASPIQWPNDVAYNPLTHQFVASYEESTEVWVRAIGVDGVPAGNPVNISAGPGTQGDARLAVDWQQNRIGVTFMGDNPLNASTTGTFLRIIDGATLQPVTTVLVLEFGFTIEPAVAFLPERGGFLSTWTGFAPDRNVMGRFVSTAGDLAGGPVAILVTGANEGAATLRYDFVSRRTLVAAMSEPKNIFGTLLDGLGTPLTTPFNLTTVAAASGSFFPAIAPASGGKVGVSFIIDYSTAFVERFQLPPAGDPGPECCSGGPPPPPASPPTITSHPSDTSVPAGAGATLTVTAAGTAPLSYQWYTGTSPNTGSPIPGATSASYATPALTSTTSYWVRVSNSVGSANSTTATVTVAGGGGGGGAGGGGPNPSVRGDFDGDRRAEITVFRPSNGMWYSLVSSLGYGSSVSVLWGASGDIPVAADFDGDGINDVTVFRPSDGSWSILRSGTGFTSAWVFNWGTAGDEPVAADYDGDGRADVAVFRPSDGSWSILRSATGFTSAWSAVLGAAGDEPVPADYDGDGLADPAVFKWGGTWSWLKSSTGYSTSSGVFWGMEGDIPVTADFDGDGLADITVFRPSDGSWSILRSSTGLTSAWLAFWGGPGDVQAAADYDGDRRADLAVFQPSTGYWSILTSSSGFTVPNLFLWGTTGDIPLPRR